MIERTALSFLPSRNHRRNTAVMSSRWSARSRRWSGRSRCLQVTRAQRALQCGWRCPPRRTRSRHRHRRDEGRPGLQAWTGWRESDACFRRMP